MRRISLFGMLVIVLVLGQSCIEEQDYGQYDDLSVVPEFESSIIYIESTEEVINQASSSVFYSQTFDFDVFNEKIFADRVVSGTITYNLINTTSKDLEVVLEFLDESGTTIDTERFSIAETPSPITQIDVVYGDTGKSLGILKLTESIRVSAENLGDTSSISSQTNPLIVLKSSGKFSIRVK